MTTEDPQASPDPATVTETTDLVALGVVARPHGVHGELRVHRYNPDSRLLLKLRELHLGNDPAGPPARVRNARMGPKGMILMVIEGVLGRDAAEALRGVELLVPRSVLPPTDEDEWYHVDLIGLSAVAEDGAALGRVVDVVEYPTIDCLAILSDQEVREVPLAEPYLIEVRLGEAVILGPIEDLPPRAPTKRERGQ